MRKQTNRPAGTAGTLTGKRTTRHDGVSKPRRRPARKAGLLFLGATRGLALAASLLLFQCSAFADPGSLEVSHGSSTVCQLATPAPSGWADTESSVNVAVTNWPGLGRHIYLTLAAFATPSNNVQVAFGKDADADGDLAPEETMLCIGVDCGEPFARDESKSGVEVEQRNLSTCSADQPEQETIHHCSTSPSSSPSSSPSPSTFTFSFKQPSAVNKRITHAKVTTRGRVESAAEIAAEIKRFGVLLFLR